MEENKKHLRIKPVVKIKLKKTDDEVRRLAEEFAQFLNDEFRPDGGEPIEAAQLIENSLELIQMFDLTIEKLEAYYDYWKELTTLIKKQVSE